MCCEEVPLWPCGAAAKGASNMVKKITTILFAALFCGFFGISIAAAEQNPSPAIDGDTGEEYPGNDNTGGSDGDGDNGDGDNGDGDNGDGDNGDGDNGDGDNGDGDNGDTGSTTSAASTFGSSNSANQEESCRNSLAGVFSKTRRSRACSGPFFRN